MKFFSSEKKNKNENDEKNIKQNVIAFIIIIAISIIIAFFNWSKGIKMAKTPSDGETQIRKDIENSLKQLGNIFNESAEDAKNVLQKNKEQSYGYGYSNIIPIDNYGYGSNDNIDYKELLKKIKPEDIEQYMQDYNDINDTLKK